MREPIRIGKKVHKMQGKNAETAVKIGKDLLEAREHLQHGQFEIWLRNECSISIKAAYHYMHAARRFGDNLHNFEDLPLESFYALASPSTPDEVIDMVESGKILPTLAEIKQARKTITSVERPNSDE